MTDERVAWTLDGMEIESGVSMFTGEGFVVIRAKGEGDRVMVGQLSPAEARAHGLIFIEAAEAAETDSLIWTMFQGMDDGPDEKVVGGFISQLRELRAKGDEK